MFFRASELKRFPASGDTIRNGEITILIHGLFLFGHILYPLAKHLSKSGLECIVYDYPTRLKGIEGHALDLAEFLNTLIERKPEKKINIVTHSLGGIIARATMKHLSPSAYSALRHIVMIVPPNKGSDTARIVCALLPFSSSMSRPLHELSNRHDSPIHELESIDTTTMKLGIIGTKYDRCVREPLYHLDNTKYEYIRMNHTHSMILLTSELHKNVYSFICEGHFPPS